MSLYFRTLIVITSFWVLSCTSDFSSTSQQKQEFTSIKNNAESKSVQCSTCHNYPIPSGQHNFHLIDEQESGPNGIITCLDCHFESIQHTKQNVGENLYLYIPQISSLSFDDKTKGIEVTDLNTLVEFMDGFLSKHPHQTPQLITGEKHLNNQINLSFAPNTISPSNNPHWNPSQKTCSMIECHNNPQEEYSWK